ncbi:complement receptor type 1-like isoform X4 [Trachemys scripta elegans]|uniref:complement receptor type 1-like isoform X4 n=1 Tax=Trachemys scripta elegans TaxID=31138 RepID=UPI001551BBF3|nr:complement receptor type 1-like isoform X4 [Trachemys scripta elegans]
MELLRASWAPRVSALLVLALLPRGALGNCGAPPRLTSAELQDEFKTQTDFAVGTTVRYSCRSGYQRVPGVPPTLTCERDSVWSEPKEFCQRKSCGHPGDLVNGKVHITDLLFGSSITFSCDEGFRLIGSKTSQCVIDGTKVLWNHEIPFCEEIPCRPPPEIENGRYNGDPNNHYTYGSTVTYSCNTGGTERFSLIGATSIYCTADEDQNGIWSGEPPECKVVKCSNVEVENGRKLSGLGPSYTYQDAITFGCNAGYFLVGRNEIKCQANNSWSPAIPTCEKITPTVCGTPQFSNGQILPSKPRYDTGDGITLTCEANYVLFDGAKSMTVHCKGNNVWDPPVPTCQISGVCPELVIHHGTVKSGAKPPYSVGDHVTIECSTSYTLHGEPNIQCTGEFQWKPAIPECSLSVITIVIIIVVIVVIAAVILAVFTWIYKKYFSQKGSYQTDENCKEACILNTKVPDESEASALKN